MKSWGHEFESRVTLQMFLAEWQSGHAVDCKSIHLGSTPGSASIIEFARVVKSVDTRDLKSLDLWS